MTGRNGAWAGMRAGPPGNAPERRAHPHLRGAGMPSRKDELHGGPAYAESRTVWESAVPPYFGAPRRGPLSTPFSPACGRDYRARDPPAPFISAAPEWFSSLLRRGVFQPRTLAVSLRNRHRGSAQGPESHPLLDAVLRLLVSLIAFRMKVQTAQVTVKGVRVGRRAEAVASDRSARKLPATCFCPA